LFVFFGFLACALPFFVFFFFFFTKFTFIKTFPERCWMDNKFGRQNYQFLRQLEFNA